MYCTPMSACARTSSGLWVSLPSPAGVCLRQPLPMPYESTGLPVQVPGQGINSMAVRAADMAGMHVGGMRVVPVAGMMPTLMSSSEEPAPGDADLKAYKSALLRKGRAITTIDKYLHGILTFLAWLGDRLPSAEFIRLWMTERQESGAAVSSINGTLSALNGFWKFLGRHELLMPHLKIERSQYVPEERRLTEGDFRKLLEAAKDCPQVLTLLQTIASTGVRVSEVRFFTVEGVKDGVITVTNKGKTREVVLHKATKKMLLDYCKTVGIKSGIIFTNKKGAALSRGYIWYVLKRLCRKAGVAESKVFPHNLRRLFAVRVYRQTKDIDFVRRRLGHRSAVTTSLYIRGSLDEDRKRLDELRLVG